MLTIEKNVDTNILLDNIDIRNLAEAYVQALTKKEDRLQALNGYLIKQEENTLFAFIPILNSLVTNSTIKETQVISKTLQECYTDIIASLLLADKTSLPTHIRIAGCIHHPSHNHWTMLLVECTHGEEAKKEYDALYTEYQKNPRLKEGQHPLPLNAAKNFLKKEKKLIFSGDSEKIVSNWQLPLSSVNITLTHYDSLSPTQPQRSYTEIKEASDTFLQIHKANLNHGPCEKQEDNTCGDWSVYNAFTQGLQKKNSTPPSSKDLRLLSFHRSTNNIKKILSSSKKKKLERASEEDQINFPSNSEEEQNCLVLSRSILPITQPPPIKQFTKNTAVALLTPSEKCNDFYPTIHLISKMLFTLLFAHIAFSLIPSIILPSFLSFSLGLAIGFFTYDSAISDCFGKKEIILKSADGDSLTYEKNEESGFLQALGFTFAPYHKELKTLEKEIADIIGEHPAQEATVRDFIKSELYPAAPDCFYKSDIDRINSPTYSLTLRKKP